MSITADCYARLGTAKLLRLCSGTLKGAATQTKVYLIRYIAPMVGQSTPLLYHLRLG